MMEQNEIEKGNRLIAEFMNWTIEPDMENENDPYYNKGFSMVLASKMKYHTSYDWLMPVCKKAKDICYYHRGAITNSTMILANLEANIRAMVSEYDIGKAFFYLIQFITYHNTLNPHTVENEK